MTPPWRPTRKAYWAAETRTHSAKTEAQAWYSDHVLPFEITLSGTNENGAATCMKIFGVEILNEGSGTSIHCRHRDAGDLRRALRRASSKSS